MKSLICAVFGHTPREEYHGNINIRDMDYDDDAILYNDISMNCCKRCNVLYVESIEKYYPIKMPINNEEPKR